MQHFENWINEHLNLNALIKNSYGLDDTVESFANLIHEAAFVSTPQESHQSRGNIVQLSAEIREFIANKRRFRRVYQNTRSPLDKTNFNS